MAKKKEREIIISQKTEANPDGVRPLAILKETDNAFSSDLNIATVLGAIQFGKQVIASLESKIDLLEDQLQKAGYDKVIDQLIKEGSLEEGETPIISTVTVAKDGKVTKNSYSMTKSITHTLDMSRFKEAVKDPAVFRALPEEFKKTDIKGSPFFTDLYKKGEIPSAYASYFEMEDHEKISIREKKIKDKEETL